MQNTHIGAALAALEVVASTDRMTTMATARSPAARALRDAALATASRIPAARNSITLWVSGLKRSPLRHHLPPLKPRSAHHAHKLTSRPVRRTSP